MIYLEKNSVFVGIQKKLDAAAKQAECDVLFRWKKSVVNHLYWCALSSAGTELAKIICCVRLGIKMITNTVLIRHNLIT